MSTLRSNKRNKILRNKSLIRGADIVLSLLVLIRLVPDSMKNVQISWHLILWLNLVGS